jgi:hypothetical protein
MKQITTTFLTLSLLIIGLVGIASAKEAQLNRATIVDLGSFSFTKRTTGAGQVTEIIKRKIGKIYGVIPVIVIRPAKIPPVEIPTVEIPTVEIQEVEIPTVEIPVVELPFRGIEKDEIRWVR